MRNTPSVIVQTVARVLIQLDGRDKMMWMGMMWTEKRKGWRLRLVCVGPGVSTIRAVISPPNLN